LIEKLRCRSPPPVREDARNIPETFFSAIDSGRSVAINAIFGLFRDGGEAMALIGVLKSLNFDNLSDEEKADLKDKLQKHRKELKDTSALVDKHLKTLSKKKKRKAPKKR
jgi:hypothetical protein